MKIRKIKSIISLILTITVTAAAGCRESEAPYSDEDTGSESVSEAYETSEGYEPDEFIETGETEPDITEPEPQETEPEPQETEPPENNYGLDEYEQLKDYVYRLSYAWMCSLPAFEDINDVHLTTLLLQYCWQFQAPKDLYYDYEGFYERFGVYAYADVSGFAVYPETLDSYFKENLNPGFSIESYDYKSETEAEGGMGYVYDGETNAIVLYSNVLDGGMGRALKITDMYEENGYYYVSSLIIDDDVFGNVTAGNYQHAFTKNANGVLNIMSIREISGEIPDSLKAADKFFEIFDEYTLYHNIAFYDRDNDGVKEVVMFYEKYNDSERKIAVVDLDSGTIEQMPDLDCGALDFIGISPAYESTEFTIYEIFMMYY